MHLMIRINLDAYSEDNMNGVTAPVVRFDYDVTKEISGDYIEKRDESHLSKFMPHVRRGMKAIFYHVNLDPRLAAHPYTCIEGELDYKEKYGWFAKKLGKEQHLKDLKEYGQ